MRNTLMMLAASLMLLALNPEARAAEGALEINPLCVASGCFAGDNPGFPVEIASPGHYVLTGNLDVTGESSPENVTAIRVRVSGSNSTLDLNGFTIRGPVSCSGGPPVTGCSPAVGSGDGVLVENNTSVSICNGAIIRMGDEGIFCPLGTSCELSSLRLE